MEMFIKLDDLSCFSIKLQASEYVFEVKTLKIKQKEDGIFLKKRQLNSPFILNYECFVLRFC